MEYSWPVDGLVHFYTCASLTVVLRGKLKSRRSSNSTLGTFGYRGVDRAIVAAAAILTFCLDICAGTLEEIALPTVVLLAAGVVVNRLCYFMLTVDCIFLTCGSKSEW